MIIPFLNARQGWNDPEFLHPTLIPALEETEGVVVFHEQVLLIVAETTGVTLAQADEVRRAHGHPARAGARSRRGGVRRRSPAATPRT